MVAREAPAVETREAGSLLSQIRILYELPTGEIYGYAPVGLINYDDVPVDEDHVQALKRQMLREREKSDGKGSGQISPIALSEIPGRSALFITDGYHRARVFRDLSGSSLNTGGEYNEILCVIKPNSTEEDVIDRRIVAASTHQNVIFSRVAEWVGQAWKKTPWHDKLEASQAFGITGSGTSGVGFGLTREEAVEVKKWVTKKSALWEIGAGTIQKHLLTAEAADPDLIKEVRPRKGGSGRLEALTAAHLQAITSIFPHRYAEQRIIAGLVRGHNLSVGQTRQLVAQLGTARNEDALRRIAADVDFRNLNLPARRGSKPQRRPDLKLLPGVDTDKPEESDPARQWFMDEVELVSLALANAVARGDYAPDSVDEVLDREGEAAFALDSSDRDYDGLPTTYENANLMAQLRERAATLRPSFLNLKVFASSPNKEERVDARLEAALARLDESVTSGALRHIDLGVIWPYLLDRLIIRSFNAEGQSRRGTEELEPELSDDDEVSEPLVCSLEQMIQAHQLAAPLVRRVIVMHGLMDLSPNTMAQLLKTDKRAVGHLVETARISLQRASRTGR